MESSYTIAARFYITRLRRSKKRRSLNDQVNDRQDIEVNTRIEKEKKDEKKKDFSVLEVYLYGVGTVGGTVYWGIR